MSNRYHYWQFLVDASGEPIEDALIFIYEAGTENDVVVYTSEHGSDVISESPQLITNASGFFQFFVADYRDQVNGYPFTQKFKIKWEKGELSYGEIDEINIFPPFEIGQFVPEGGGSNDVLIKSTAIDFDTEWSSFAYDHVSDITIHREINDSGTQNIDLWSAEKIHSELEEKDNYLYWKIKDSFEDTGDDVTAELDVVITGDTGINTERNATYITISLDANINDVNDVDAVEPLEHNILVFSASEKWESKNLGDILDYTSHDRIIDHSEVVVYTDGLLSGGGNITESMTISLSASDINHSEINYDQNEHIDHSTVELSAGDGMLGGGDITESRAIILGTPTSISRDSHNTVYEDSHTHELSGNIPSSYTQIISATEWLSGNEYSYNVHHDINNDFPSVICWDLDVRKVTNDIEIESLDKDTIKLTTFIAINTVVKIIG